MSLFSRSTSKGDTGLADAVFKDVAAAYARFIAAHANETITALSLCTVDDAVPPYIMGATLEDGIEPVGTTLSEGIERTWAADPADWSWSDAGNSYRFDKIISDILNDKNMSFEQRADTIFQGIVKGLKMFDASGQFKGMLPRDQMLLVLWINDPSEKNARSVMNWVSQMNPKPVSAWFNAVYSYRT